MANFNDSISGTIVIKRESAAKFETLVADVASDDFSSELVQETENTQTHFISGFTGEDHGGNEGFGELLEKLPKIVAERSVIVMTHLRWETPNQGTSIYTITPNGETDYQAVGWGSVRKGK